MLKMLIIVYNEAIDMEVMEILRSLALEGYTKTMAVFGKGQASGIHLGKEIWPGRNNILYIACQESSARKALAMVKELRKKLRQEGIKAFLMPLEEIT